MLQDQRYLAIMTSLNQKLQKKREILHKKHLIKKRLITRRFELCKMLRENRNSIIQIIELIGGIIYYVIRTIF